jgi:hypothetical protein
MSSKVFGIKELHNGEVKILDFLSLGFKNYATDIHRRFPRLGVLTERLPFLIE